MKKKLFYIITTIVLLISLVTAVTSFYLGDYDACVFSSAVGIICFVALFIALSLTTKWDLGGAGFYSDYV